MGIIERRYMLIISGLMKGLTHRSFVLREFSLILYVQYSGLVSV